MRCLGQQIMTSGAGLEWKVIRMWDYPMMKHNSNILRVPTDFGDRRGMEGNFNIKRDIFNII